MYTVRVNDLALFFVIEGDCPTIFCCVGILTLKNNFTCSTLVVVALAQLKKESWRDDEPAHNSSTCKVGARWEERVWGISWIRAAASYDGHFLPPYI